MEATIMRKKNATSETAALKQRTPVQDAVLELRKSQGWSQQAFATFLGKSINSVAVWETSRPPTGLSLILLKEASTRLRRRDLAEVFDRAVKSTVQFLNNDDGKRKSRVV